MRAFRKRVSVIESDPRVLAFVTSLIELSEKYFFCSGYSSVADALVEIKNDIPDIIVMGLDFKGNGDVDSISKVKRKLPQTDLLIISTSAEVEIAVAALSAGANGYVLNDALNTLTNHLDELSNGGSPLNPIVARKIISSLQITHTSPISERETEVLRLIMKGNTYTKIAAHLNISKETAKTHIKNIYKKLHVNSRSEAVRKALEERIISSSSLAFVH